MDGAETVQLSFNEWIMNFQSKISTFVFSTAAFVPPVFYGLRRWKNTRDLRAYADNPTTLLPPNAIKRLVILEAFERLGQEIFVETGTYYGETTRLLSQAAKRVLTVELSPTHYSIALRTSKRPNIELTLGDSREFLRRVTPQLRGKICFFLDAHPTNPETTPEGEIDIPILEELRIVTASPQTSLIIIDDAVGGEGYPSIDAVRNFANRSGYTFSLSHNMMFLEKLP
jgi:hypothetical protein